MASSYSSLVSIENLFQVWDEFKKGKRKKLDVQIFERNLEDNLFGLHEKLKAKSYKHGSYSEFYVNDPKRRHIHKAQVADRIVHHLLYKYLYGLFDKTFIHDSYSCRFNKGTHKAVDRLEKFTKIVSKNYSRECWALKLDIKKFFASVDHQILLDLIKQEVQDPEILWLITEVISSFHSNRGSTPKGVGPLKGIPLGNLTSQIYANIYLNELDHFVKQELKIKYYIRYADDFLFLSPSKHYLLHCIESVKCYLADQLNLDLHPQKIIFRKFSWGIDFCGYIVLPHYILPRTKTKKRIINKITKGDISNQSLQSYLGYFSHASSYCLQKDLINVYFLTSLL